MYILEVSWLKILEGDHSTRINPRVEGGRRDAHNRVGDADVEEAEAEATVVEVGDVALERFDLLQHGQRCEASGGASELVELVGDVVTG